MLGERADGCLILLLTGTLLLAAAAAVYLTSEAEPGILSTAPRPTPSPPAGLPPGLETDRGARWGLIVPGLLVVSGTAAVLGAVVMLLHASAWRSGAPPAPRVCRRCGHTQKHRLEAACEHCGAPIGCPRCGLDLTRVNADVCGRCGVPWGCPSCGYSFKGLASNPCPTCGAPATCHRCGADLTFNITGRCGKCGAAIRGWRAWR